MLTYYILGVICVFLYGMYKNKSAEEGDKATNIQMAFTSLLWPAYVGWLC